MSESRYLCVHLPEFPTQSLLRLRKEAGTCGAVAVMEGAAPLERVCSMNRMASGMGVRAGMTKAELDSFDGLKILRRSVEEERSAKAAVLEIAGAFTPRVEDHTAGPHATAGACVVVLDVSGTEQLFGPVERLGKLLGGALQKLGLRARIGVSTNLLTAIVVARFDGERRQRRTATVIPRGEERSALAGLPIATLQPIGAQAETFVAWGLRSVGELAALDEVDLVVRMGQEGAFLWRLARGQAEHLMVPVEAGLELQEIVEFDAPVDGMESLMFVLGPMLDHLIARAGNRALQLASVRVEMGLERFDGGTEDAVEHVRVIKPALPVADRVLLLKLLHLDLEAHPPCAGVVRLRVTAEAGGRSTLQAGLFSPQMPEAGRLEVTLARLAGMVGESRVGRARLRDSHAPESFVMEKFLLPEPSRDARRETRRSREERQELLQKKLKELSEASSRRREAKTSMKTSEALSSAGERTMEVWKEQSRQGSTAAVSSVKVLQMVAPGEEKDAAEQGSEQRAAVGDAGRCAVAVRRLRPAVPIRWKGEQETAFWMEGVLYEVRERYGPWRRSGAWWMGDVWSREEWDVTVEAGGGLRLLCVLTHDLLRDRWHMDGMYD